VDQYAAFAASTLTPLVRHIEDHAFKATPVDNAVRVQLDAEVRKLDKQLNGKKFLVGDHMTLADILVFCSLISAFQLVLDADFRKSVPHLTKWFNHMASLPEVRKRAGAIKGCQVEIKP